MKDEDKLKFFQLNRLPYIYFQKCLAAKCYNCCFALRQQGFITVALL